MKLMAKIIIFLGLRSLKLKYMKGLSRVEEVYKNQFYGTLNSELDRIFSLGKM